MSILQVLIQFVFRATFGVALAMGITPSKSVSAGFYRVHLWVLMGLNTLASLAIYTQQETLRGQLRNVSLVLGMAVGLAAASYVGSVVWLYEKARLGQLLLFAIAGMGLCAAVWGDAATRIVGATQEVLGVLNVVSSGLVLGTVLTSMFLGHWYLNTPTMDLLPLRRLVLLIILAVLLRAVTSGTGLILQAQSAAPMAAVFWIFVALRWLSGLVGVLLVAVMTWHTLRIPNTQSATGILYAGVILLFIGELTSQFLSADALYPL